MPIWNPDIINEAAEMVKVSMVGQFLNQTTFIFLQYRRQYLTILAECIGKKVFQSDLRKLSQRKIKLPSHLLY